MKIIRKLQIKKSRNKNMINLTIVFAALAIISLMVMTVFIVAGIKRKSTFECSR